MNEKKITEGRLDYIDVKHYKATVIKSIRNYYKKDEQIREQNKKT